MALVEPGASRLTGTIYALASPDSGEIRYCGKTVRSCHERLISHRYDATVLKLNRHVCYWLRQIYACGKEPRLFVCEEVDISGCDRKEQMRRLNEAERRWISQLKCLGFDLTNHTSGGDGCHDREVSAETRDRIGRAHRGKVILPEHRDKMRQGQLARDRDTFVRGEAHPNYRKPFVCDDPAARAAKIKASLSKAETRATLSEKHRGSKNAHATITEETARAIYLAVGSTPKIAAAFGVTVSVVNNIKHRRCWSVATADLPDHPPLRGQTRLTAEQVSAIRNSSESPKLLAKQFGIGVTTVYQVKSGATWKGVK